MLKPGYKQTDLGVLPEEWEVKTLGEVLKGVRLGGNYANTLAPTAFPLIKMANLNRSVISLARLEFIRPGIVPESRHKLKFGDLLFNTRNTLDLVGKVAIWRDELPTAFYNSNILRLDFDPCQIASPFFVNYIINTEQAITQMRGLATGTTSVAAVYTRDLLTFQIPVPPLAEQRAIAETLGAVDALLTRQRALLAKKRDLKQATQQALLTRARRLPGFSGEWQEKTFGDVITGFSSGATPFRGNKHYYTGTIKWVTSGELNYNIITETLEHISADAAKRTNLTLLPKGTFLMAITGLEAAGTRGSCAILGTKATTNQSCMALFPGKELLNDYLFHYYVHYGDELAFRYCQGTKQQSYTGKIVKLLPIYLPPVDEQRAIVEVLNDMDEELKQLAAQLAKTEALKQGLMQDLLTGTIRLTGAGHSTTV